ncbi:MAG: hypothetical protein KF746_04150 [Chitinophagaceae bacterium]|nr:hypothetical protein [Chitinophagaceae bacterium]
MKKIMPFLLCYIVLNACNGGGNAGPAVVDSLPENESFFDRPTDTVYPKTDTTAINKAPEKKSDTSNKK